MAEITLLVEITLLWQALMCAYCANDVVMRFKEDSYIKELEVVPDRTMTAINGFWCLGMSETQRCLYTWPKFDDSTL